MTKPKPPRPVRAWAIDVEGDPIDIQDLHYTRREAMNEARALSDSVYPMSAKPIRVTLVPDGATSAEAEMLRKLHDAATAYLLYHASERESQTRARLVKVVNEIDAALRRKGGSR